MKTSDFDYDLPEERIAYRPAAERQNSKLMVLERGNGEITHKKFFELPGLLSPGDLLILNDTKVIPARLFGRKKSGERAEILLVEKRDSRVWTCLVRNPREGLVIGFDGGPSGRLFSEGAGVWLVEFSEDADSYIEGSGRMPLPPYIKRSPERALPLDVERYQTIFAHHRGAMVAVIGLMNDAIQAICQESGASAANYNAPDQVVLSGTVESIERAEVLAKTKGAKRTIRLDVAGAFHSSLMQPAATTFQQALAKVEIRPPRFPVVSNVTARPVQDPEEIRELLVKQIVSPVLWDASMRSLIQAGATHFIEFPPARVLTGLLRRIDSRVKGVTIDEPTDFEKLEGMIPVIAKKDSSD